MFEIDPRRLTFPVLCLARDSAICVSSSVDQLSRCSAVAFYRQRYFDQLMLIDSNAAFFTVSSAEPVTPLSGIRRWLARVMNERLEVRLRLEPAGPAGLAGVKLRVMQWLDRSPGIWKGSGDLAAWKRRVSVAQTMKDLITLFARVV